MDPLFLVRVQSADSRRDLCAYLLQSGYVMRDCCVWVHGYQFSG